MAGHALDNVDLTTVRGGGTDAQPQSGSTVPSWYSVFTRPAPKNWYEAINAGRHGMGMR